MCTAFEREQDKLDFLQQAELDDAIAELIDYEMNQVGVTHRMYYSEYSEFMEQLASEGKIERKKPRGNITCMFCGVGGLHWQQYGTRWKTTDSKGFIHTCSR